MKTDVRILIADDDHGHVSLIKKNLLRSGISNPIIHFKDGQEVLDFLFGLPNHSSPHKNLESYLLLLDIRMPKVDGVEVLQRIKKDQELRKIPTIILSTTDDPFDISRCHYFGCSTYITKPIEYNKFEGAIRELAAFLKVVEIPIINIPIKALPDTPGGNNKGDGE